MIARNKLDLATEYVELGDVSGARMLIHEVLESADAGTHDAARALLSDTCAIVVMRIALGVEYDGAAFCGWQTQPHGNTVQDVLERALGEFTQTPLKTVVAGRTDTGVHGLGAGGAFRHRTEPRAVFVGSARAPTHCCRDTVAVRWAQPMPDTFHARFSAFERTYYYLLYVHPVRSPMLAGRAGWIHTPLDVDAMRAAAACLIGEHDFSAFRSSGVPGENAGQASARDRHAAERRFHPVPLSRECVFCTTWCAT